MSIKGGPNIVTDGLVLHLDAADKNSYPGSGFTWIDLSGNGNDGTLVNGPIFSSNNGGSLSFDGANDYVNLGTSLTNGYINISVSIWCYITSNNGNNNLELVTKYPGANGWIVRYLVDTNKFSAQGREDGNLFISIPTSNTYSINNWYNVVFTKNASNWRLYVNSSLDADTNIDSGTVPFNNNGILSIASIPTFNFYSKSNIAQVSIYNRALSATEIQNNYLATKGRFIPNGTIEKPFNSPYQAQSLGYGDGNYYFLDGSMSTPTLLEFKNNYYEGRSWVCVFRSPYNSTATTNKLGLNIPMGGLLVQRDTLDLRAAVYWSNPITYNAVGGSGNNTADSGYSPRRVILGYAGGHGIYATNQAQCSWSNGVGAIGAGWNGSTCGSFPNNLLWGTGQSNTATYTNMSGIWSHWIYWE